MRIAIDGEAAFPSQELINRKTGALTLDIPERHIDAAQGIVQHWSVAPVRTRVSCLPNVLNIIRIAAATKRVKILFDRGFDCEGPLLKRSASQSVEAGFARLYLNYHEPDSLGCSQDRAHACNFKRGCPFAGFGRHVRRVGVDSESRGQTHSAAAEGGACGELLQKRSSIHRNKGWSGNNKPSPL